jgi:hypothetical protein
MNKPSRTIYRLHLIGFVIAICFPFAQPSTTAQSGGGFEITEAAIASGSAMMSADDFQIDGTVGQPAAGDALLSDQFTITSGFWNYTALAPTAAGVSISGRIVTAEGVGIGNARLFLQTQNGEILVSRSASFGYYMFEDIAAGQVVFITVEHKLFTFEPQTVMVVDSVADLDFTGQPR